MEFKHVDDDEFDDEDFVSPAPTSTSLKKPGSHLSIQRPGAEKDLEEAAARGTDITVIFHLPGGKSERGNFPVRATNLRLCLAVS
jgi:hypothetical protein